MTTKQRNALGSLAVLAAALAAVGLYLLGRPRENKPPVRVIQFADVPTTPEEVAALEEDDGAAVPNFGYVPDRQDIAAFIESLEAPTLREAAPHLFLPDELAEPKQGEGADSVRGPPADGEPVLLYRALHEAYAARNGGQQWRVGKQGIGDCVSWGWAHGCDILLAVDWKLQRSGEWRPAATEAIYGGSRVEARGKPGDGARAYGGWGDGSYGAAAAKWVNRWGILFREPYPFADLTRYDSRRAKDWGAYGCGGQEGGVAADDAARAHPIQQVAVVDDFESAAVAIQNGYPVPVCSGQGFSSTRDADGFCRPSGNWSHCMCFVGARFDRRGLLCLNSWGPNWVRGPKWPEDQPDGSFWVDERTATRMLSGRDSFAVAGYKGFPRRRLKNSEGW